MNPIAAVLAAVAVAVVLWEVTRTRRDFAQHRRRQQRDAAEHAHRYGY